LAIKALFTRVLPRLDLDEPHIQARVPVRVEPESSGNVNGTNDNIGCYVVENGVLRPDLHTGTRARHFTPFPGGGRRPGAALGGANERRRLCRRRIVAAQAARSPGHGQEGTYAQDAREVHHVPSKQECSHGLISVSGGRRSWWVRFQSNLSSG